MLTILQWKSEHVILLLGVIQWLYISLAIKFRMEAPNLSTEVLGGLALTSCPVAVPVIPVVIHALPAVSHHWAFIADKPPDHNTFLALLCLASSF